MKINVKQLVAGSMLFAVMGASAENQPVTVMTMDTLKGISNLKANQRGDKLKPIFGNSKRREDEFFQVRFRGIDMSDKPLMTWDKDKKPSKTAKQKKVENKTADSED